MRADPSPEPVFVDRTGTRYRWWTTFGVLSAAVLSLVAAGIPARLPGGGIRAPPGPPRPPAPGPGRGRAAAGAGPSGPRSGAPPPPRPAPPRPPGPPPPPP